MRALQMDGVGEERFGVGAPHAKVPNQAEIGFAVVRRGRYVLKFRIDTNAHAASPSLVARLATIVDHRILRSP